ncbi:unnamed protein product [Spirodela intermedia]|uniref:CCDC22 coiled-coil domain-containing protein n=1 Tax=Spirodela intermedia TaxID=51605 RepID=A0A7I8LHU7_SPIIN|nr:unnamed protein product [Spirodela intermedia]
MTQGDDKYSTKLVEKLVSLHEQVSKMQNIIENQQSQEKMLTEGLSAKASEAQDLEDELQIYKLIGEMALEDTQCTEMYIMELGKKIDARSSGLLELKTQWKAFAKSFEERRALIELELYGNKPDQLEKLQQLKEMELETGVIRSELHKREEECSRLATDLENQPKIPLRRSYLQRITEITRNSRKQDADIEQIIRDTRELQLESNSINERLHRAYAVVNEAVSRYIQWAFDPKWSFLI